MADAHAEVHDMLRSEEIEHLLGHISRKDSSEDLVMELLDSEERTVKNPAISKQQ